MVYALLWWAVLLVLGMGFLPFTHTIFRKFRDMGWMFSKMTGLFLAAWLTWVCNVAGLMPFGRLSALTVAAGLIILNYAYYLVIVRRRPSGSFAGRADEVGFQQAWKLMLAEEAGFLGLMLLWMWIVGFKPDAFGTEKFMDYAFLTSMDRGTSMPFADPWYAGEPVNYYYGGQYITAWLMKLTGTSPGIAYNVMRCVVTACSFMLPFSLAFQLMYDRVNATVVKKMRKLGIFSGQPGKEEAGTPDGGLLRSAREAQRKMSSNGRKEVRRRRERVAVYRSGRFLADTPDPDAGEREASSAEGTDGGRRARDGGRTRGRSAEGTDGGRRARDGGRTRGRSGMPGRGIGRRFAGKSAAVRNPAAPACILCGILAGMATSMCGTFHYLLYGIVRQLADPSYSYWFPDTTRYIGYDPDIPDKTIHEFPAYSSVLGDLHAHYINILFVLTVTAVVYAWARKQDEEHPAPLPFFAPEILLTGLMTGSFRWTNFWDFPIYFVVAGAVIFFVNMRLYRGHFFRFAGVTLAEAAVVAGVGYVAALPFTQHFDMISSEVAMTHSHTLFHQFLVVWGFPFILLLWYALTLLREQRHAWKRSGDVLKRRCRLALPDLTVLILGLCAAGLTVLPEVIYVKDIYGADHYRANTMFKLTYQAFILFAIVMAYVLVRVFVVNSFRAFEEEFRVETKQDVELADMLASADLAAQAALRESGGGGDPLDPLAEHAEEMDTGQEASGKEEKESREHRMSVYAGLKEQHRRQGTGRRIRMACASAGIVLLCILAGYMPTSVHTWFGNILNAQARVGDDAAVFVKENYPDDAEAITWLNENVDGQPVVLEAAGDSYSNTGRVSVATGLPTVEGWYVHEWLWRNDVDALNERRRDIQDLYTSDDPGTVRQLIDKYDLTYIYIGTLERQTYPGIQDELLQKQGTVAYSDGKTTYIMKVN